MPRTKITDPDLLTILKVLNFDTKGFLDASVSSLLRKYGFTIYKWVPSDFGGGVDTVERSGYNTDWGNFELYICGKAAEPSTRYRFKTCYELVLHLKLHIDKVSELAERLRRSYVDS